MIDKHPIIPKPTALMNHHWWEWNERVWGVEAKEFDFREGDGSGSTLQGVLFQGSRGKVVAPPLNPHVSIAYLSGSRDPQGHHSHARTWTAAMDRLADAVASAGMHSAVVLPPGMTDARSFAWAGLRVEASYNFLISLPRDVSLAHRSVAKQIRKATSRGYFAERSDDWAAIVSCLKETEAAKGFRHRLSLGMVRLGADLMGPETFRGYVVRDSQRRPVSGGIRLHAPGHLAIDWVQGATRPALADGVNWLMYDFVMADLHQAGAVAFDLGGANIRQVAAAKANWGYPVVPQMRITEPGILHEVRDSIAKSAATRRVLFRFRGLGASLGTCAR